MEKTIKKLIDNEKDTCLSLVIPMQYTIAKEKIELIIKEAVHHTQKKLKATCDQEVYHTIMDRLRSLCASLSLSHSPHGVGFFISSTGFTSLYHFHTPVSAKTIISDSFELQDVIYDLKHSNSYYVLVLNKKATRLYKGVAYDLYEVFDGAFPRSFEDIKQNLDGEQALNLVHKKLENRFKTFLKNVYTVTEHYIHIDQYPLVLVGLPKYISIIKSFFHKNVRLLGELKVDVHHPTDKLSKLLAPLVDRHHAAQEAACCAMLDKCPPSRSVYRGIESVLEAVNLGKRLPHLMVEKDYEVEGYVDEQSGSLFLSSRPERSLRSIPNLVEHLLEKVIRRHDSKVDVLSNNRLASYGHVALLTSSS